MSVWIWVAIIVAAIVVTAVVTTLLVRKHASKKVAYMMDALEDGEMNFRFSDTSEINRNLNRFRDISERRTANKETDSWNKLFRVMTHEIMNTIAPIASLSDALSKSEDVDVKAGLETISTSSKDLIRFVESYRNFANVTPPVRKAVMVDELIERVLRLNKAKAAEQNVTLRYEANTPDLLIFVDEGQMMLVFNNLIKNAIQAGATDIRITSDLNMDDQTVIHVSNNGKPIPLHQQEEIFVPFYTTKPNGTGIGLSLSRQIMIKHNGTLKLVQSGGNLTVFVLVFK